MILRNEIFKLIHSRIFLFVLACALLLNIYAAYSENFGMSCPAAEYKEYYAIADGKNFQEAYDYTVARRDNMFAGWEMEKWHVRLMMNAQLEQLRAVATYPDYLKSIDDSAATMTAVSIFADPDSFSYKNIVKTPSAYDRVRSIRPKFAPSNGALLATENIFSDLLLLFLIFTAVTVVFYKDRESMITALIKPLRYGRTRLAVMKTATVFLCCLFGLGLFFGLNLMIGSARFGLGDLSRPVQSLEGYLGCNLPISVGQFLVLTFIFKLFSMFICALIAQALFIRLKNIHAYLVIIAAAGVETALFLLISETSLFSVFKQINLAAFVRASRIFRTYQNINFFNTPINLLWSTVAAIVVLMICLFILTLRLYQTISISEIKKTRRRKHLRHIPKHLFSYTLYKQFVLHKGVLIILAALAFQVYTAYNYTRPYNITDNYYSAYTYEVYGMATPNDVYDYMTTAGEELNEGYVAAMNGQLQDNGYWSRRNAFEKLASQYKRVYNVSRSRIPSMMYYTSGYEELFGVTKTGLKQDYVLGFIAILGICFAVAPMIAYDNRARIGFLLYTTAAGKRRYFVHKAVAAAIFTFMISLAVYLPYYFQILRAYGIVGITESVRAVPGFENLAEASVVGYLIIMTLLRVFSLTCFAELVLYMSHRAKSPTTVTILTLALFALPILIYLAGANFMQWLCWPVSINREILRAIA